MGGAHSEPGEVKITCYSRLKGGFSVWKEARMDFVSKPHSTAAVWEHFGLNDRGERISVKEQACQIFNIYLMQLFRARESILIFWFWFIAL